MGLLLYKRLIPPGIGVMPSRRPNQPPTQYNTSTEARQDSGTLNQSRTVGM